jgi:hypothetical protein
MQSESDSHWGGFFLELALIVAGLLVYRARSALMALWLQVGYRRRKVLISSGRNRHATPFCISKYLRNRLRAGGTTSQGAKLVGCHVKIVSSGAKHKPNPTGGAEGSEISGLPKAGKRTKTQRFRKKGVLEGLHKEIGGLYRAT